MTNLKQFEFPEEYPKLTDQEIAKMYNGCGSGIFKIEDVRFEAACKIHDVEYSKKFAKNAEARFIADRRFLRNMLIKLKRWDVLGKLKAYALYACVRVFGKLFYGKS